MSTTVSVTATPFDLSIFIMHKDVFLIKAANEDHKTKFCSRTNFLASSPLLILFGYLAMVDAAFLHRKNISLIIYKLDLKHA